MSTFSQSLSCLTHHLPLWLVIPQSPPRYRRPLKSFSRNPQRPCRTFAKPWPWRRALDEYKNKDNDLGKGLIEERINEPWASITFTFFIQSTTRDCRPASTIFYFRFWARRSKYLSGLEPEYLDVKSVFVCPHSPSSPAADWAAASGDIQEQRGNILTGKKVPARNIQCFSE